MPKSLVLNFHQETNSRMFEKMLLAMKARYEMVSAATIGELAHSKTYRSSIAHITVDDGDRTFYDVIFPLAEKHEVPVSLFVSPKIIQEKINFWFQNIEKANPHELKSVISNYCDVPLDLLLPYENGFLLKALKIQDIHRIVDIYLSLHPKAKPAYQNITTEQLLEIDRSKWVEVGAHTMNHPILKNETDESSAYEIDRSIQDLSALLKRPVTLFAYPNGRPGIDFTEREKRSLQANGIQTAFSTEMNHLHNHMDPLSIPRMGFARMGLHPQNPLVSLRLQLGKKWPDIRAIGRKPEPVMRRNIWNMMNHKTHQPPVKLVHA